MDDLKTTNQVIAELGITKPALLNWLKRNPTYRPEHRYGEGHTTMMLWSDTEIEKVKVARQETRKLMRRPRTRVHGKKGG